MVNSVTQKIRQPAPSLPQKSETKEEQAEIVKYRPAANVGVIDPSHITTTPLTDWIENKKEEMPHIIYKLKDKKYSIIKPHTAISVGIVACGIISLFKLFKK